MSTLSIDFETRSTVSLPDCGVYVYAEHPDTDIWCMAWAFDDDEPRLWTPTPITANIPWRAPGDGPAVWNHFPHTYYLLPWEIQEHIEEGGAMRAHNAQFERIMWREVMVKRYGAPPVRDDQWYCSAAEAAAMSLPRSLGECARVTGIAEQKDTEGHNLMMRMCRPRRVEDDGTLVWWTDADKVARLGAYCITDVKTEQALSRVLRRLSPDERAVYLLDQRINDRGVRVDTALVGAAQSIADEGIARANAALTALTDGGVETVTNHGALRTWLAAEGVVTDSVDKPAVAALLETDLAPLVRDVLLVRADAGRSSIAKLKTMARCTCDDARARGLYLYHAATTGRWGGRLIQPQNFPRGEVKDPESFIPDVLAGDYDRIDVIAHPVIAVLSMLRGMLTATPGHVLVAGDFKSIEACVLNWLAGQADVCALFRDYFAGDKSKDPYVVMARRMGVDVTRQAGKAAELGFGFGMGEEKFVSAAWDVYQVRVTLEQALAAKQAYRAAHPMVQALWYATNAACMSAIDTPGVPVTFGALQNLRAIVAGAYLYIALPSGRVLCYPAPRITDGPTPWGEVRPGITYSGVDSYTNKWCRQRTYGGHLVENIVQAVARDLLAAAMLRLEDAGYPVVLHAHDELVVEKPFDNNYQRQLYRIMEELPTWATGCPVAVDGWQGVRYRK